MWEGLEDDLGELGPLVKEELVRGIHAERVLAMQSQRRIAAANARIEQATIDGLGQKIMSVDLTAWMFWQLKEPGCWADKGFRKAIMRDNPEVRVKYTPPSNKVMVDGFRDRKPQPEAVAA